jgi:O-antigen ligase
VFSGLFKWVGLPFDPTLVFGILTLLLMVFYLPVYNIEKLNFFIFPLFFFFIFHLFYFCSAFYSPSKAYYIDKMFRVSFNLIGFLAPIVIFRTTSNFLFLKKIALVFFIITLAFLSYNWLVNKLEIFFKEDLYAEVIFPNYMTISYFLGSLIFFFYEKKSVLFILLKTISVLFIILLASKGVILFMLLILFLDYKNIKIFKKENFKFLVPFVLFFVLYLSFSGQNIFQNIGNRIFIGDDFEQDQSSLVRLSLLNNSFNLIKENPVFGIGIGGFGILSENVDDRLSPHNILVEVLLETGVIGFLVFLLMIYFFYKAFKTSLQDKEDRSLYYSFLYPCLFIFMGDLVSGIIEDSRINYFWLGLAVSYFVHRNNESREISINKVVVN